MNDRPSRIVKKVTGRSEKSEPSVNIINQEKEGWRSLYKVSHGGIARNNA